MIYRWLACSWAQPRDVQGFWGHPRVTFQWWN